MTQHFSDIPTCKGCQQPFEKNPRGRPALFCGACRPRTKKAAPPIVDRETLLQALKMEEVELTRYGHQKQTARDATFRAIEHHLVPDRVRIMATLSGCTAFLDENSVERRTLALCPNLEVHTFERDLDRLKIIHEQIEQLPQDLQQRIIAHHGDIFTDIAKVGAGRKGIDILGNDGTATTTGSLKQAIRSLVAEDLLGRRSVMENNVSGQARTERFQEIPPETFHHYVMRELTGVRRRVRQSSYQEYQGLRVPMHHSVLLIG